MVFEPLSDIGFQKTMHNQGFVICDNEPSEVLETSVVVVEWSRFHRVMVVM